MTNEEITQKIKEITNRHGHMNCYLFALVMSHEVGGKILYNGDHCIVSYYGTMFDQTGVFTEIKEDYGEETRDSLIDAITNKDIIV